MNEIHASRIARVCARLEENQITQMIVSDPLTIRYLTGIWVQPMERLYALYLRTDGKHCMFLNKLFSIPATDLEQLWFSDTDDGIGVIAKYIAAANSSDKPCPQTDCNSLSAPAGSPLTLGIDKNWSAGFLLRLMECLPELHYVNASYCIDSVRSIKDAYEKEKMRESSRFNDLCIEKAAAFTREGMTEKEVANYISSLFKEAGCTAGFPPIVSFGPNAADPHHEPDDTVLKKGDCIVIDMGCIKDEYCSDMTRTYFCGEPDAQSAAVHDLVRRANEKAESLIRPGVRFCDLDAAARDLITEAGYGPYFTHRLGHSIGIEDHEPGDVSSVNTDCVQEGMTFSIEPGVYLPGKVGVRVEDLVLVTADGCEILNKVDKHWKSIG